MSSKTDKPRINVNLRGFERVAGSPDQLPPAPESVMLQVIAREQIGTTEERQRLSAFEMLDETTQNEARLHAEQLLDVWLQDTMAMILYGKPVIDAMNGIIERQRRDIKVVEVPELRPLMLRLNKDMRRVGQTFDISNSKILERLEKELNRSRRFYEKAASTIQTLQLESQTMEESFGEIEAVVDEAMNDMLQNIQSYDEIIRGSENEMMNLVGVLGILEAVRDLTLARMADINVDPTDISQTSEHQQLVKLKDFLGLLEKKIAEYKNRLVQSRLDTEETLDARRATVDTYQQFDAVEDFVIPRMKKTLLQWSRYVETYGHSKTGQVIIEIGEEWNRKSSENAMEVLPKIAANASVLTSSQETMETVIHNNLQRIESMLEVYEHSRERQRNLEDLYARSQRLSQQAETADAEKLLDEHARLSKAHSRLTS